MILTDRQIREACEAGDIVIEPFDDGQVQAATYDFRVGNQGATTSTKKLIDIKRKVIFPSLPVILGSLQSMRKLNWERNTQLGLG